MLNLLNLNLQSSCKIANGDSYFNFFTPKSLNLKTKKKQWILMFLMYVLYLTGKVCARFQPPPTVAHLIKIESEMHRSSEAKKKHCQLTQLIDHYRKCHNMLFNVCHPIVLHHFVWIFCILYGILCIVFGSLGWLVSLYRDRVTNFEWYCSLGI